MQPGNLVVVSGPSGAGKGTVCGKLFEVYDNIAYSVSATTRQPREGEVDGVNYWFTSREAFQQMIKEEKLLEWAEVYGNYYGTPLERVQETLNSGKDVLLEIDTQGAMLVQEKIPDGVYIFILPPSLSELRSRIEKRGSETAESMQRRLAAADKEIEMAKKYDYVIVNDVVDTAVDKMIAVLKAEKLKTNRCKTVIDNIKKG